ncbi:MAG: CZB domain-containing protein [Rhodospirillales bacterium]|nr:CZB domain-containing protein [Rhodospirillales bacterium]MCB9973664.1 CZB domain-containing protein [Rhodospirillales bacterium]MCB9980639.1 CZB domain-containing protein [Rhodospirillales bacterium]
MTDQALFSLTTDEQHHLKKITPKLDLGTIIDALYDEFIAQPTIAPFFKGRDLSVIKKKQLQHWQKLLAPDSYQEALKHSVYIGSIHEKLGVNIHYYLSAYAFILEKIITQAVFSLPVFSGAKKRHQTVSAIVKVLMSDAAVSLQAYLEKTDATSLKRSQKNTAEEIINFAVDASMSMNHLFIDSLKGIRTANDVDQRVHSISAAIEEMSATVGTITENTQQALEYTQKTSSSAAEGRSVSDRAMETMSIISQAVEETAAKSQHLSESSRQIEGIITKIQDIAEQTNLLALNATIEAARAGDAGKGFAVVANEVKSLSNETSKATQEITSIVASFLTSIQEIVSSMQKVAESVETGQKVTEDVKQRMHEIEAHAKLVGDRMSDISHTLVEQSQASSEISQASTQILDSSRLSKELSEQTGTLSRQSNEKVMNLIAQASTLSEQSSQIIVKLAKSDHIVWKRKLSDLIIGGNQLDQKELTDHTQCRLGKWYYSTGKEHFGTFEAYKKLEEPHARIHKLGHEAYKLYQDHRQDEALLKLDEMEHVSTVVIGLLNELDAECQKRNEDAAAEKAA